MRQTCLLITICLVCACHSSPKKTVAEAPPAVYQPSPVAEPVRLTVAAAPKVVEVQEAVKRVFKDGAEVDQSHEPNFIQGDFNGDGSQDIAIILKPVKLEIMNQELPPWLVRDPRANKDPRVLMRIEKDEPLLAVIHGYGTNDWRDPEATQTFVLKNVATNDLKVHSGKEFITANSGRKLPRPQGDLIGATLPGTSGYLYYAAASYAWYDPKTYKGDTTPGVFHKSRMK